MKKPYLVAVIKIGIVSELEEVDMPSLLDKYREDGAAEIISADIKELEENQISIVLQDLVKA